MKLSKYIIPFFLCAALLFAAVPTAFAETQYVVTGKNTVQIPAPGYEPGSVSTNCWTFAQAIYELIWGERFSGDRGTADDMLRNVPTGEARALTLENIKRFISAARPGASIRISQIIDGGDDVGGYRHSQILVYHDENGFTVYEGSINGRVRLKYYTWEEYANGYFGQHYGYFKYIKWPGAPAFDNSVTYDQFCVTAQYNGETLRDLSGLATFDVFVDGALKANDVSAYADIFRTGTAYEIRDVRTADCVAFSYSRSEAIWGTMNGENVTATLYLTDAHGYTDVAARGEETHTLTCANDPGHSVTEPHNWDGGALASDETDAEELAIVYTCRVCGAQKTETVPADTMIIRVTDGEILPGETLTLSIIAPNADAFDAFVPEFDETVFTLTKEVKPLFSSATRNFFGSFELQADEKAASGCYTVTVVYENAKVLGGTVTVLDPDVLPAFMPGDVDGDGSISSADARLALRATILLESFFPRTSAFLACDTDGDECITSADARRILRASVDLEALSEAF